MFGLRYSKYENIFISVGTNKTWLSTMGLPNLFKDDEKSSTNQKTR